MKDHSVMWDHFSRTISSYDFHLPFKTTFWRNHRVVLNDSFHCIHVCTITGILIPENVSSFCILSLTILVASCNTCAASSIEQFSRRYWSMASKRSPGWMVPVRWETDPFFRSEMMRGSPGFLSRGAAIESRRSRWRTTSYNETVGLS